MRVKFKSERGASAVEFAIILPVLLLVVFGIIEMSLVLYDKAILTNASREGARAGIVSQNPRVTDTNIQGVVDAYAKDHLVTLGGANNPPQTTISPGYATRQNATFGSDLTVTVTYQYGFLVLPNFMASALGPINLEAKTVMKME